MDFYIADAFTSELFGGNPAGVVILDSNEDFPSDEIMRKTAAELRYSETAFIKQLSADEFNIRYFTPADEVDLCGHATIASFKCLLDAGLVKSGHTYTNVTAAGRLNIRVEDSFITMEMASPEYISTIDDDAALRELYEIMGTEYTPVSTSSSSQPAESVELLPMVISTGLPDIMMPVSSTEQLNSLAPDFPKLAELSKKYNVTGVHAFAVNETDTEITANCRNFAPLYDIDEEAATGTSSGALGYYFYRHDLITVGSKAVFLQGEAMQRPSNILAFIEPAAENSDEISIFVGGDSKILSKGNIFLNFSF